MDFKSRLHPGILSPIVKDKTVPLYHCKGYVHFFQVNAGEGEVDVFFFDQKTAAEKKSMAIPTLYTYFRSSCSYRVRIALHYKNIPFRSKSVNLLQGEQRGEEYRELNPLKMVPMLEIDGLRLGQSMAIIEYK